MTFSLLVNQIDCFEARVQKSKLSGIWFESRENQKIFPVNFITKYAQFT